MYCIHMAYMHYICCIKHYMYCIHMVYIHYIYCIRHYMCVYYGNVHEGGIKIVWRPTNMVCQQKTILVYYIVLTNNWFVRQYGLAVVCQQTVDAVLTWQVEGCFWFTIKRFLSFTSISSIHLHCLLFLLFFCSLMSIKVTEIQIV